MMTKPDFSKDTGPGTPGVNNEHTPGTYYMSCQVEDTGCGICRTNVGYWEHDGTQLYGTEGQQRSYIWTLSPQDIPAKCTICDECLEPFIARGDLELFTDGNSKVQDLSNIAKKAVFTSGARTIINIFAEVNPMPDTPSDFILPLTAEEINQIMTFANETQGMETVLHAGSHYAMAALAFGKVLGDPSFEAAADYYVDVWIPAQEPDVNDLESYTEEELLRLLLEATNGGDQPPTL